MGIDYVGAAIDIATEQAASFKIVQVWTWASAGMDMGHHAMSNVDVFVF